MTNSSDPADRRELGWSPHRPTRRRAEDRSDAALAESPRSAAEQARDSEAQSRAVTSYADERTLTAELVGIGRKVVRSSTVDDALEDIVRALKRAVPGCSFASFAGRRGDGEVVTLAATDPEAVVVDHLQYSLGDGPGIAAMTANEVVRVADVALEARWPDFARQAARVVGSVVSTPIPDESRPERAVGSLNIYGIEPNVFDAGSSEAATLLAAHVAVLMALSTTIEQLQYALQSRDVIGQAKGILMERQNLTPEAAFDVLRRSSQRSNMKLRDVAAELTARASQPRTDPTSPKVGDTRPSSTPG